ncbi:hypothetical protein ACHAW6_003064 [Cyclotella cf. meneghiniana]
MCMNCLQRRKQFDICMQQQDFPHKQHGLRQFEQAIMTRVQKDLQRKWNDVQTCNTRHAPKLSRESNTNIQGSFCCYPQWSA